MAGRTTCRKTAHPLALQRANGQDVLLVDAPGGVPDGDQNLEKQNEGDHRHLGGVAETQEQEHDRQQDDLRDEVGQIDGRGEIGVGLGRAPHEKAQGQARRDCQEDGGQHPPEAHAEVEGQVACLTVFSELTKITRTVDSQT